jgi:hypothetical protein
MSDTVQAPFRQESLPSLAARFRVEHEAAQSAAGAELRHAMAAGDILIIMKDKAGYRGFGTECKTYFATVAARTLRQYMQLATARPVIEAKWHDHATFSIQEALRLIRSGSSQPSKRNKSALPSGVTFNRASLEDRRGFLAGIDLIKCLEALPLQMRSELERRVAKHQARASSVTSDKVSKALRSALSYAAMRTPEARASAVAALSGINNLLNGAGLDLHDTEVVINARAKRQAA